MKKFLSRFRFSILTEGLLVIILLSGGATAFGQHESHRPPPKTPAQPAPSPSPTPRVDEPSKPGMEMPSTSPTQPAANEKMPAPSPSPGMEDMSGHDMGPMLVMTGNDMAVRVGPSETNLLYCGQMGSGTSWAPHSSPINMWHKIAGDWLVMLHFNVVAGVNSQGGPRGTTKFESNNWLMPMAFHKLGKGTLQLRGMFSAEPFTIAPGGSPLLFQTGETYKGRPLIDKQHPHDLFMELSMQYTLPLGEHGTWFTYFGYPGEPALGPDAFMHRASAAENPSAPLSHHLMDSTHISFGVLTGGFTYRWLKLEGSIFNGREPDENRYDFDAHKWNSRSVRLSVAPNQDWSMQVSYGFLRSPENQEPGVDIRRATASLQYNKSFNRGNWSSSLIWGRNHVSGHGETRNLNGYTAESTVNFLDKNYLYTRLELVDKDELLNSTERALLGITQHHPSFRIGAYTFGGVRDVWKNDKLVLGVGADATFYSKPEILNSLYGEHPVSWRVFFRIRPANTHMAMMTNEPKTKAKPAHKH